ncbi:DUF1871 family protein [Paenibacillus sp. DYY-L-2]|uniref:DUF1871 family protein n=1 Tax=Paenibacillus sp. DYY-L-2 TaxID=3447013 RepID=UPI003F4FD7A2
MSKKQIITDWDPQCLMSHAPDDEYDFESKLIEDCLLSIDGIDGLTRVIQQVFIEQFGEDFIKTTEECLKIAEQIILSRNIFKAKIKNKNLFLIEGKQYKFRFVDSEISFNNMIAEVMETHWIDTDTGKVFFYIYVIEHAEDYLVSDDEVFEIIQS